MTEAIQPKLTAISVKQMATNDANNTTTSIRIHDPSRRLGHPLPCRAATPATELRNRAARLATAITAQKPTSMTEACCAADQIASSKNTNAAAQCTSLRWPMYQSITWSLHLY